MISPSKLVALCLSRGLRVIALTDHDTTNGIIEALEAARSTGLNVIPGVELSTDVPGAEAHVLGYYVDWQHSELQEVLTQLRSSRNQRARAMLHKLIESGMPLDWTRIEKMAAGGAIGRPHIARVMIEQGYVSSELDAFERYLGRGRPAYVERYKLSPEEAVKLICKAGGIPVLAHPMVFDNRSNELKGLDMEVLLPRLVAAGLEGIEARYPYYPADLTTRLMELAASLGLITTGGTDFHKHDGNNTGPGDVWVPLSVVTALKERLERRRAH
jgi:hypothetical protein